MPQVTGFVARNRGGERVGTYAVCSAYPSVIDAAIQQTLQDGSILHVESTSGLLISGRKRRVRPRQR